MHDGGGTQYYRINIDHGNQSQGGNDAIVIGNVANTQTDCLNTIYELKVLNNAAIPFEISTDQVGSIWVLFATDSGFEGITNIYFTRVKIIAEEI